MAKSSKKSSGHVQPVKTGSEDHNQRLKQLNYVFPERTKDNAQDVQKTISEVYKTISEGYKQTYGQKMQDKSAPIRECVAVLDGDESNEVLMQRLKDFSDAIKEKWGIKTFQTYIHRDEGHIDDSGEWQCNCHAHLLFDWTNDPGTHRAVIDKKLSTKEEKVYMDADVSYRTIKLTPQAMAEFQTILAEKLQMERGVSSDREHLTSIEYKIKAKQEQAINLDLVIDFKEAQLEDIKDAVTDLNIEAEKAESIKNNAVEQTNRISKSLEDLILRSGNTVDPCSSLQQKVSLATSVVRDMRTEVNDLKVERKDIQENVVKDLNLVRNIAGYTDNRLVADKLIEHIDKLKENPDTATRDDVYALGNAMYLLQERPSYEIALLIGKEYANYPQKAQDFLCNKFDLPEGFDAGSFKIEVTNAAIIRDYENPSFSKDNVFANLLKPVSYIEIFADSVRNAIDGYGEKASGMLDDFNKTKLARFADCFGLDVTKISFDSSVELKGKFEKELGEVSEANKAIYDMLPYLKRFVYVNMPDAKVDENTTPFGFVNYAYEILFEHEDIRKGMKDHTAAYERGMESGKKELQPTILKLEEKVSSLNEKLVVEQKATATEKDRADNAEQKLEDLKDTIVASALKVKPINTLYEAGLRMKDAIIELFTNMKTKFSGTLNYDGEKIRCKDEEITIKKDDPDPYVKDININTVAQVVREMRIQEELNSAKFIRPSDDGSTPKGPRHSR